MLFIDLIKNNLGTIVVLFAVVIILALLTVKLVKDKKAGKSGCSCGCSSCAMSEVCHSKKQS